jgi:hypothetical protein
MPCQIGLTLGLGLCRTLRSKANRTLPWTRTLESKGKSGSSLDSDSGVQRRIGLILELGLPSPKKIGLFLGLGLRGPRLDRTLKSAPLKSDSGLDLDSVRFLGGGGGVLGGGGGKRRCWLVGACSGGDTPCSGGASRVRGRQSGTIHGLHLPGLYCSYVLPPGKRNVATRIPADSRAREPHSRSRIAARRFDRRKLGPKLEAALIRRPEGVAELQPNPEPATRSSTCGIASHPPCRGRAPGRRAQKINQPPHTELLAFDEPEGAAFNGGRGSGCHNFSGCDQYRAILTTTD